MYRSEIDGIRAVAVLSVILYHLGLGCPGGYVGVDVFLVISGYLISGILCRELSDGTFSLKKFWERRVRRLLPALLLVLLCSLAAGWFILIPSDFRQLGASLLAQTLLASNVYFWKVSTTGYFAEPIEGNPLLHTWSLSLEEQFYLVFPIVLWALYRRRWLCPLVIGVCLASFALNLHFVSRHPMNAFYLLPTRIWELGLGVLLSLAPPRKLPREGLAWLGLALVVGAICCLDKQTPFPGAAALAPCLGTACLLWAGGGNRVSRLLALRPCVFVGQISYSLYLWHWPLIAYTEYLTCRPLTLPVKLLLLVLCVLLGATSWKLVEQPFRRRLLNPWRMFAASSVLVGTLGATVFVGNGFPTRCPESALQLLRPLLAEGRAGLCHSEVPPQKVVDGQVVPLGAAGSPTFLVWGDSHAMAELPVFQELGQKLGLSGCAICCNSTPPLTHYPGPFYREGLQSVGPWGVSVLDLVARKKIGAVFLVAHWVSYPQELGQNLRATVAELRARGARVWIVVDTPDQLVLAPRAALLHDWQRTSFQGISTEQLGLQRATLDDALGSLEAGQYTRLDPSTLLSEGGICPLLRQGALLYRDRHHLSLQGARQLRPLFEPVLRGLLP